jgi:Arc/MetJ family transcription regulator
VYIKAAIMRTNIVLNDKLITEAKKYTKVKTKKEIVELALQEFVDNHKRKDLRDLKGKIKFKEDYDYKKMRNGLVNDIS